MSVSSSPSFPYKTRSRLRFCWLLLLLWIPLVSTAKIIVEPEEAGSTTYTLETPTETANDAILPTPTAKPLSEGDILASKALNILKQLPSKHVEAPKPKKSSAFSRAWSRWSKRSHGDTSLAILDADLEKLRKAEHIEVKPNDAPHLKRAKAVRMLEIAAIDLDSEEASFMLAEINFFAPFGHPRNLTAAFHYYTHCAHQFGNATAQGMLGFMWTTGIGAPNRDQAKSMLYYTFATMNPSSSDTGAEMSLGYRHLAGIGTSKSCEEAVWYFKRAAQKSIDYFLSGPPMGGHSLPPAKHRLSDDEGGLYGPGASGAGGSTSQKSVGDGALTPEDVFQYWQYTAERGDATAQLLLGQLYYTGTNAVVQNYLEALRYFQMAATQYDAQHAQQAQNYQQWQAKHPEYQQQGAQKVKPPPGSPQPLTHAQSQRLNAAAQASGYVGQMHFRGEGIEADNTTARKWFERGAQRGDAISLTGLGIMYKDGSAGLPKDLKKATSYFTKAAEQNNAEAQLQLGLIYLSQGKKEHANALRYFTQASRHGHLLAMYNLGEMYLQGYGTQANCQIGAAFFKNVAEKGDWHDPLVDDAIDAFYDDDLETAMLEFLVAAERGYEVAQSNVGYMIDRQYYPTSSNMFDTADARHIAMIYWNRAANQGNVDARIKMGDYFYYGIGSVSDVLPWKQLPQGKPDYSRAASYYQTAADSEHSAQAMFNLGWMHETGTGVEKDYHLAKRYYDRALSTNPEAYLPVNLALAKLNVKRFFSRFFGGEKVVKEAPVKTDMPPLVDVDKLAQQGEDEEYAWWAKTGDEVEAAAENVMILLLSILAVLLLYVRRHRYRMLDNPPPPRPIELAPAPVLQ